MIDFLATTKLSSNNKDYEVMMVLSKFFDTHQNKKNAIYFILYLF